MLYCPLNGHLLILPDDTKVTLKNNLEMERVKDKRMLVRGLVKAEDPSIKKDYIFTNTDEYITLKGSYVYYPLYAAIQMILDGMAMHLVPIKDIVIYEGTVE